MNAQVDVESAQQVNSPKYWIRSHQTKDRLNTSDKKNCIAIFDILNLRTYHVEIDSQRYPRDRVLIKYEKNDFIQQYKVLKLFFKDNIGEPILNPPILYPDMKTKYPVGIIDLRHQPHRITPKKTQPFHEDSTDPDNARLFLVLIRRRQTELISDGNKLIEVKVI